MNPTNFALYITVSKKINSDKINKAGTYVNAVVVEVRIGMEFVRRVVLVSVQELTPQIPINVRRCRYIEGETRHNFKASESAV